MDPKLVLQPPTDCGSGRRSAWRSDYQGVRSSSPTTSLEREAAALSPRPPYAVTCKPGDHLVS